MILLWLEIGQVHETPTILPRPVHEGLFAHAFRSSICCSMLRANGNIEHQSVYTQNCEQKFSKVFSVTNQGNPEKIV